MIRRLLPAGCHLCCGPQRQRNWVQRWTLYLELQLQMHPKKTGKKQQPLTQRNPSAEITCNPTIPHGTELPGSRRGTVQTGSPQSRPHGWGCGDERQMVMFRWSFSARGGLLGRSFRGVDSRSQTCSPACSLYSMGTSPNAGSIHMGVNCEPSAG